MVSGGGNYRKDIVCLWATNLVQPLCRSCTWPCTWTWSCRNGRNSFFRRGRICEEATDREQTLVYIQTHTYKDTYTHTNTHKHTQTHTNTQKHIQAHTPLHACCPVNENNKVNNSRRFGQMVPTGWHWFLFRWRRLLIGQVSCWRKRVWYFGSNKNSWFLKQEMRYTSHGVKVSMIDFLESTISLNKNNFILKFFIFLFRLHKQLQLLLQRQPLCCSHTCATILEVNLTDVFFRKVVALCLHPVTGSVGFVVKLKTNYTKNFY